MCQVLNDILRPILSYMIYKAIVHIQFSIKIKLDNRDVYEKTN